MRKQPLAAVMGANSPLDCHGDHCLISFAVFHVVSVYVLGAAELLITFDINAAPLFRRLGYVLKPAVRRDDGLCG